MAKDWMSEGIGWPIVLFLVWFLLSLFRLAWDGPDSNAQARGGTE